MASAFDLGPKAVRVYLALRDRITGGEWVVGGKLPAHQDLAEEYGIATLTMRQVLAKLEDDGLVLRQQGRGTFVRKPSQPIVVIIAVDSKVASQLADTVRTTGAEPITVTNEADARAALENAQHQAVVFSQIRLPEPQDGIGLIRAIRRRWPTLPVAAITDHPADLADLFGTLEAPVLIIFPPFRPDHVIEALGMALRTPSSSPSK